MRLVQIKWQFIHHLQVYAWAAELNLSCKLLLAGPTDFELTSTSKLIPIGETTGPTTLKVVSREEAEKWAFNAVFTLMVS